LKSSTLPGSFFIVALVTGVLLLVPLVAMQFTEEVDWSTGDFAIATSLIFGAGTAIVLGTRCARGRFGRIIVVAVVGLLLAVIWAQLALGAKL